MTTKQALIIACGALNDMKKSFEEKESRLHEGYDGDKAKELGEAREQIIKDYQL